MLNNKKGLSGIILTIIMIGLVIVAVGIVWYVILGVLEGQSESIDLSQQCVGIIIKPKSLVCAGGVCTVVLERSIGSRGDAVDGVGITLSTDTESDDEVIELGNVAVTKTITLNSTLEATDVSVRAYFIQDEEEKFCSQVSNLQ